MRARGYVIVFIQHVTRLLLPIGCSIYALRLSNSLLIVTLPVTLITRSTMNWRQVSNDTNI